MASDTGNVIDSVSGAAASVFSEVNEKVEFGLAFISKYAIYFWIVLVIFVVSKVFKLKIKI